MDFLQVGRQFRKAQTDRWKPEPASGHLTAPRGGFCAKHLAKSFSRGSGTARALSWKDQAVVSKKLHTACYIAQAVPPLIHLGYVYHARLQRARIKALLNHTNYYKKNYSLSLSNALGYQGMMQGTVKHHLVLAVTLTFFI